MFYKSQKKKVIHSYSINKKHWVGDGFHVLGLIRPSENFNNIISPFILLDYAPPKKFLASKKKKGVSQHPHRGFETVTISYQGEIEHRDSSGGGGMIKAGDVQWMTAGKGVLHEELHSKKFCNKGGVFEMVQLWINLPSKFKLTPPKYQEIKKKDIPLIKIGQSSELRLIAGKYDCYHGPADTFTQINIYDVLSYNKDKLSFSLSQSTNTVILVFSGWIRMFNETYTENSVVILDSKGEKIQFDCSGKLKALILNGEPINEPICAHGPFVMNTKEEIIQAISDYKSGLMGLL